MSDLGLAEAKVAIEAFDLARKRGWFDKLIAACRKKHKILLLGSTGRGKTNLLKSLTEVVPQAIHHLNRTEFGQKHHIQISDQPFIFVDTPGQVHHAPRRLEAIRETMAQGISGIINVVSYGYHEYRRGIKEVFNDDGTVRESYLQGHRQVEIDAVKEWSALLGDRTTAGWLITVVTKADLWWDRKDEVMDHYLVGEYFHGLGDAQNLNPAVIHYCSVFHRFYGVGQLSGMFDESDRTMVRGHLLRTLLEAIGKGEIDE